MRRQPPLELTPPQITHQIPATVIEQNRTYKLITPLFGGGAIQQQYDEVTTIRGTEIRGQLRFWWRACRGGQFQGNPEKLKEMEDFIWGKAYKKGDEAAKHQDTIQIAVDATRPDEIRHLYPFKKPQSESGAQHQDTTDIPKYAAFPLQEKRQAVFDNISFTLTITFPEKKQLGKDEVKIEDEVLAALWAWETFGGIGARTRRGFGALRCESIKQIKDVEEFLPLDLPLADPAQASAWLQKKLDHHVGKTNIWPPNMPHLPEVIITNKTCKIVKRGSSTDPISIWKAIIAKLGKFRQMGRLSPGKKVPGLSLWPEPDTIRYLTNQSLKREGHQPVPQPPVDKFPRAAFGLPIIFHFKDNGDPGQTVLQPKGYEHFASPLILKPLACLQNNYVGLAMILAGSHPESEQLELKTQQGHEQTWGSDSIRAVLDEDEKLTLRDSEYRFEAQINSQTHLLQVFLRYL